MRPGVPQNPRGRSQRCTRGDDIVHDEHDPAFDTACTAQVRTRSPFARGTAGLRRATITYEKTHGHEIEVNRDGAGEQRAVVDPAARTPTSTRRNPRDHVDGPRRIRARLREPRTEPVYCHPLVPILDARDQLARHPFVGERRDRPADTGYRPTRRRRPHRRETRRTHRLGPAPTARAPSGQQQ